MTINRATHSVIAISGSGRDEKLKTQDVQRTTKQILQLLAEVHAKALEDREGT